MVLSILPLILFAKAGKRRPPIFPRIASPNSHDKYLRFPAIPVRKQWFMFDNDGGKTGGEKAPRTTVRSDLGIWRTRRQRHDIFRKLPLHKVGNSKDDGSYRTISPSESERSRLFPASDLPSPTTQPADDTILGEYADYCIEISGQQNDGRLSVAHLTRPSTTRFYPEGGAACRGISGR